MLKKLLFYVILMIFIPQMSIAGQETFWSVKPTLNINASPICKNIIGGDPPEIIFEETGIGFEIYEYKKDIPILSYSSADFLSQR
ncbi:MAG: hypothetical protein ABIE68_04290 [bacterium]